MRLTKEAILNSELAHSDIEVPDLGGTVTVRQMTARERNEFVRRAASDEAESTGAWLVATLTINEDGTQMFSPDDVVKLQEKSFKIIDAIGGEILKLNGLTKDSRGAAAKN